MIIATAQSPITGDVRRNGKAVRRLMRRAAGAGARLVHFPEGALSGYAKEEVADWQDFAFDQIDEELAAVMALAGDLGIWVVLGSAHRLPPPRRPHNALYVVSDRGDLHARYDKRRCSQTEITDWYSPGFAPCLFEVEGLRFATTICIEIQFPELYVEARDADVHCMLLSTYAKTPMFAIQAQAHAATNNFWLSLSSPVNASRELPSALIGPDGHVIARCRRAAAGLAVREIDPAAAQWEIPLRRARPWRALARAGQIYEERRVR